MMMMSFDIPRVVNDARSRGPALVGIVLCLANTRGDSSLYRGTYRTGTNYASVIRHAW